MTTTHSSLPGGEGSDAQMVQSLRSVLQQIEELPSLPSVANAVLDHILKQDYNYAKLARLIESDPSLMLKIIQHANLATYSGRSQVTGIEQALNRLGSRTVQTLLLSALIRDSLIQGNRIEEEEQRGLWKHSLGTAVYAALVAEKANPGLAGEAFVAGLLHDIGRIFLHSYVNRDYVRVCRHMEELRECVVDSERAVLGTDHAYIGRWIAQKWRLPESMLNAISMHHDDVSSLRESGDILAMVVSLANLLTHVTLPGDAGWNASEQPRHKELCAVLGLTEQDIQEIHEAFMPAFADRAKVFDLEGDQVALFLSSLQKANQRLMRISLELDQTQKGLELSNRFAMLGSTASLKMSKAQTAEHVFDSVGTCMVEAVGVKKGFAYWVVPESKMLQGVIWSGEGGRRHVSFSLDGEGKPDFSTGPTLPDSLRALAGSHSERCAASSHMDRELWLRQFFMVRGYYIFPLIGSDFTGEMCILRMPDTSPKMTSQEYMGYSQVSCMASATLDRLRLFDNLQARADELARALWKNQQINLQLLQTERLAAVGQLAAGAAHEINNPLAIISARTQMLENREQDEKKRRDLRQISQQIERISIILRNLMGFARPNAPQVTNIDLNGLLEKIIGLVESVFRRHRISIKRQFDSSLPRIPGDANQLEQVFLNLAINALHAMEKSGGMLVVSTSLVENGKRVRAAIKDTGVGIAPENLQRIFDPFFTTKAEGQGTGLGLSTAYGIVANHYGEITVHSELGKGTEVRVVLPTVSTLDGKASSSAS